MSAKIDRFLAENQPATPCLVVDLARVEANYLELRRVLPQAGICYAIKANPAPEILARLVALGSAFDAASFEEVRMCLDAGAAPDAISYGSTIKKMSAIARAHAAGVALFAFDCEEELRKLAQAAPGASVYCRSLVENAGADWPLSRKFGTTAEECGRLLLLARDLGLDPAGISFHVGSQQTTTGSYATAIRDVAGVYHRLHNQGLPLRLLNLGGGFPTRYRDPVPAIADFGTAIADAMTREFGDRQPKILVEPGRHIVGDAGVVRSEIVLVSRREADAPRWVYLDIGRFGGLAETEGEAIRYAISTSRDGEPSGPVVLAGPSCDGVDILYEKTRYDLPLSLQAGDTVTLHAAGAYVSTYASQSFNGFAPLQEHYLA